MDIWTLGGDDSKEIGKTIVRLAIPLIIITIYHLNVVFPSYLFGASAGSISNTTMEICLSFIVLFYCIRFELVFSGAIFLPENEHLREMSTKYQKLENVLQRLTRIDEQLFNYYHSFKKNNTLRNLDYSSINDQITRLNAMYSELPKGKLPLEFGSTLMTLHRNISKFEVFLEVGSRETNVIGSMIADYQMMEKQISEYKRRYWRLRFDRCVLARFPLFIGCLSIVLCGYDILVGLPI